jgi:lipopolysaccharide transport system ATP-binding protein
MTTSPTEMETEKEHLPSGMIVKAECVGKKYPLTRGSHAGAPDFWALKDVSFETAPGQVLGIIGRNGAGKTTLLNILAGVLSPTEGKVSVRGRILGLFNLGVGFQDELSGRENLFLNGAILGADRQELERKLDAIIDFSELGEFIDMPLGTYSQGMRLRLGFSIVTHLDFDVLAIDEVLAVGDALFQSKCYERLMDFKRAGKTLILTAQAMDLVERLCDRIMLLDHGRLVFSGKAADAIHQYRALLKTEQFYVGSSKMTSGIIENTQKWVKDISEWGKKLGTRESMITSVDLINRWGFKCRAVKSRQPLKIRVSFHARNLIKEPHFGIAIFRNDGVYCYGPNTAFDRHLITEIRPGPGWIELKYKELLLAPGEYKISVAIWDKKETLPFDYHSGCYDLKVLGSNAAGELLKIPCKVNGRPSMPGEMIPAFGGRKDTDRGEIEGMGFKIASAKWVDAHGVSKDVLRTREAATLKIDVLDTMSRKEESYLWAGLFREDDVYCQGFVAPLRGGQCYNFVFRELPLLPGGYKISVGAWSAPAQKFLELWDNAVSFKMVFDKEDHGTVYLKHDWKWKLA